MGKLAGIRVILVGLLAGLLINDTRPSIQPLASVGSSPQAAGSQGVEPFARLPLAFVENRGQWKTPARFVARKGSVVAGAEPNAITLNLQERPIGTRATGVMVRLAFVGSSPSTKLEGGARQPGTQNFFFGNDAAKWHTELPSYGSVYYHALYEGVDLHLREASARLEYDLRLAPGADLRQVAIRTDGVERLRLASDGTLVMHTALGPIRQPVPITWYELPSGERRFVEARFRLLGHHAYGFEVPHRDMHLALVIDPGLEWSTFLGGSNMEDTPKLALDKSGDVVMTGWTRSLDFPTTPGAYDTTFSGGLFWDTFVVRLSHDGTTLLYATFLGGSSHDTSFAIALTDTGEVVVGGATSSANFPTTPGAYDTTLQSGGGTDAFVARLNSTGNQLLYSTYLGGTSHTDVVQAIAIDATGAAIIGGVTYATDFPTTPGAYDPFGDPEASDAFIARLRMQGTGPSDLAYSTYLGGNLSDDRVNALALDRTGSVVIAGETGGIGLLPTTPGAYDPSYNGGWDAFVARLRLDGTGPNDLLYLTYLGGVGYDFATALAVGRSGAVTVAGYTFVPGGTPPVNDFPTTPGAYDTTTAVHQRAFIARLNLEGNGGNDLLYSTFFGGKVLVTDYEVTRATALAVDLSGAVVLTGWTAAPDFPVTPGAADTTYNGGVTSPYSDAFVTRLRLDKTLPPAQQLLYSMFLGGASTDVAYALALDGTNAATVVGSTASANFPVTPGVYDPTYGGGDLPSAFGGDIFVTRVDLLPAGVAKYGASTPACGPIAIGVTSFPQAGNADFAITCAGAPSNASGYVAMSTGRDAVGTTIKGATLYVGLGPDQQVYWIPVTADATGYAQLPLDLSGVAAGTQGFVQFAWFNTPTCGGIGTFSASNALEITVQP